MTLTMEQIVFLGLVLVFVVLLLLLLVPTTPRGRAERKKIFKVREEEVKDWQDVSLKLERVIHALKGQIADLQKQQKLLERDVIVQKEKYAKLQGRMAQERGWQQKEASDIEKKTRESIALRHDLKKAEQHFAQEHADRLRLEKEVRDGADALTAAQARFKELDNQILKLQVQNEAYRKDITGLRAENQKLSVQHDEKTWVAKSEFIKLEQQYQFLEKELQRLKSSPHKP